MCLLTCQIWAKKGWWISRIAKKKPIQKFKAKKNAKSSSIFFLFGISLNRKSNLSNTRIITTKLTNKWVELILYIWYTLESCRKLLQMRTFCKICSFINIISGEMMQIHTVEFSSRQTYLHAAKIITEFNNIKKSIISSKSQVLAKIGSVCVREFVWGKKSH